MTPQLDVVPSLDDQDFEVRESLRRGAVASMSVLLATVVALLTNMFTDGWSRPTGAGLAVAVGLFASWEGWRAWRGSSTGEIRAESTGSATAIGSGSRANSGVIGATRDTVARRSGDARAAAGGAANTGVEVTGGDDIDGGDGGGGPIGRRG
ncbi:hypothetical protein Dvina_13585 [Dactylosporangium vinaceum]|uniref:Uncharacterized protein n=1 Tax=Dactylosporangium vinaceum TaxID=53362 RepID=A0ABV5MGD7_9ACTN|nr:hypothetical protein [Dactylosporangium vinaceum]UAB99014.1 hypothetical protein Dvina_13585 [Dactylosporangium vinaceum]